MGIGRNRGLWLFLVSGFFLTIALAQENPVPHVEELLVGKDLRRYVITVPADLNPSKKLPLIVAFHGYRGDVKTWLYEETAFGALVNKEQFIIVYPEGPIGWQAGYSQRNVKFFDALVAALEEKYPIDPDRIYVVGHSNGAVFASYLLLARPRVVAAAVAHSGLYSAENFPAKATASSLMVIWGEKDNFAPAASSSVQDLIQTYRTKEIPVESIVIPEGGHPWAGPQHHIEEKILTFLFNHRLVLPEAQKKTP